MDHVVIGTRGSALAMWQAEHVSALLRDLHPDLNVEIAHIRTRGDREARRPLSEIGDIGLFTKEIEDALLRGEIDMAVHSLKDMPSRMVQGLTLGAILERADPRDALIATNNDVTLANLPPRARVGTSSLRRRAQLLAIRSDLRVLDLRGNVDTRLQKLYDGHYDAIVLAAAGLDRLGQAKVIADYLPVDVMMPAVGQGTLCVQIRTGDANMEALVAPFEHAPSRAAALAERAFLRQLAGGCRVPIGAYAEIDGDQLYLQGLVASLDGRRLVKNGVSGSTQDSITLGKDLARLLLAAGADAILEEARNVQ